MDLGGDLKRLFGPLIQVSEKVELIHQTVKEFFLNRESDCHEENQLLPHDRNIHIALICLFCLIRNRTNGSYHASSLNTILGVRIPPFYPYAKAYCIDHRQAAGVREENYQRIQEFDMSVQRSGVTIRSPWFKKFNKLNNCQRDWKIWTCQPPFSSTILPSFLAVMGAMQMSPKINW